MKLFRYLLFALITFTIATSCSDDRDAERSSENQMLSFEIGNVKKENPTGNFTLTLPLGTDVTKLKPVITVSERAIVLPQSEKEQNFTNPVTYTVTAENGLKKTYEVTVKLEEEVDVEE